ncbi:hypothetical protein [Aurantiacibacter aquimixticola]|uniref:Uncharacterized protein n=1 Tax=Aurantiacibacter aquimixticola TaxID=1958945 RepID=A0A419RRJ2_9SPHN|nr:hypothetical protein [Aurantiacibacter aquimixticola]RJY08422.1 hypothetical protein D6201_02760 [Aurantiacibacter aquimixticola]
MTDLKAQLEADRAMRDLAKGLVENDVRNLRGDVEEESVGSRLMSRMREGADGLAEEANEFVSDNSGAVGSVFALAIAGVTAWIFRDRIEAALDRVLHGEEPQGLAEQVRAKARSIKDTLHSGDTL